MRTIKITVLMVLLLGSSYKTIKSEQFYCPCTQTTTGCQCASTDKCQEGENSCSCIQKYGFCPCKGEAEKKNTLSSAWVEIGFGELIDKITILEIKLERIDDPIKRNNITTELFSLRRSLDIILQKNPTLYDKLTTLRAELKSVNTALWESENTVYAKESRKEFDDTFIRSARTIYTQNKKRSDIKRLINILLESRIIEEKSYAA